MATYNLFNFEISYYGSSRGLLPSLPLSSAVGDPAVYYYYSDKSLFLLSLGVALIISGILIIKTKKWKLGSKKIGILIGGRNNNGLFSYNRKD